MFDCLRFWFLLLIWLFTFSFNWWLLVDLRLFELLLMTVMCFDYLIVLVSCNSSCLIAVVGCFTWYLSCEFAGVCCLVLVDCFELLLD